MEPPPGGPPDAAPPAILSIQPDSGAVLAEWHGSAVIRFNEVIDEMPRSLERLVLLSPVAGDVEVSWHRSLIRVRPREGWKRGRVYRLELRPGITDLRRNRLDSGRVVIFSTGPAIPRARLLGTVLHWTEQRALGRALVLAAPRPDTVPYLALADSTGDFTLAGIPPGEYVVRAVQDQNTNRRRDPREAYDSALVRVDSTARIVLWAFVHDTAGPRLRSVEPADSVTFRLEFSQHLDPGQRVDTSHIRLYALPDTTPVALRAVMTPMAYDSLRARERAAEDTARRATPDTGKAETPRAADTSRARQLLAARPVPVDRLVARTAQPLKPDALYLVRVRGVRNLSGAVDTSQQVLATPKPVARDTTRTNRPP
ncbi:MAG TPA: Ig-like domain-containing protein [Gemmatimonadales bacterium]